MTEPQPTERPAFWTRYIYLKLHEAGVPIKGDLHSNTQTRPTIHVDDENGEQNARYVLASYTAQSPKLWLEFGVRLETEELLRPKYLSDLLTEEVRIGTLQESPDDPEVVLGFKIRAREARLDTVINPSQLSSSYSAGEKYDAQTLCDDLVNMILRDCEGGQK